MKINDKYIDHEELTHVILKQNTPVYSNEEEMLTYIDEYFKEHGYLMIQLHIQQIYILILMIVIMKM